MLQFQERRRAWEPPPVIEDSAEADSPMMGRSEAWFTRRD